MPDAPAVLGELTALARSLSGAARRETVAARTADVLERLFDPAALAVALTRSDDPARLVLAATRGDPPPAADDPFFLDTQRAGRVVRGDAPPRLGAPLVGAGHTMGVVAVWGKRGHAFDADAEGVLGAVAAQVGLALQNAELLGLLSTGKHDWEQMADAIGDAIAILDGHGVVRRGNRPFAAMVGTPVTALPGRAWPTLFPPAWIDVLSRVLAQPGSAGASEIRHDKRIYTASALALGTGGDASVVLMIEDHTETRRLQDHLIQSEKLSAIGQLIAGVAHELNNPLASVLGFADFLAESPDVPPALAEPLKVIQQEAQRAAGIVKNLLTFARRQEGDRRRFRIETILERTAALLKNQMMAMHVELALDAEPDLPELEGSPNQLQQVVVNLVNNAAQAIATTGRDGRVTMRARRLGGATTTGGRAGGAAGMAVDISDDGPGVPAEIHDRIFEPFFTTKREGEGTGLGLSICLGIVKEHGGRLTLRSDPAAGGATFTIELPAAGAVATEEAAHAKHGPASARVLVVDDEPNIRHYMQATLAAWGHRVDVAVDGEEALARALGGGYDLIITDVRMPKLGGRELYERLRRDAPAVADRVVFATGDLVRDDTMAFLEHSRRPCLHKPFKLAELRSVVAGALSK